MFTSSARLLDSLADRLERASALDAVSAPLSAAVAKVLRRPGVTEVLSGSPIGHPLHPLLVTVPIGSWTGAAVLDALRQKKAARTMVGLGVLASAPTVLSGLSDWSDTMEGEQRVGVVHGLLNTATLGLYAASWVARRRGRDGLGFVLTLPAMGLLGVSGWLGGHLSYALGVGIDTTAFQQLEVDWTDAAAAADVITGTLVKCDLGATAVVLTRLPEGRVVAFADRCTHRGGPLDEGTVVDGCVECPWHGSRFNLSDGSVETGPATRPQAAYEVREVGGRIEVRRGDEARSLRSNPVGG